MRSRFGRRLASPLLILGLLLVAAPAFAAEVVDVRVGLHPTFTRVVFELDSAAGYQLSKAVPGSGAEELVVILQATSIPRRVQAPRKSLLGLVRVAPEGRTAIARIELKKSGLVVKERIMSSPYRVVLDVIDPAAEAAAARKPAPKPKAAPAPKPAAKPKPAPKPEPKAAAPPAPKPAPKPAAAKPPPTPPAPDLGSPARTTPPPAKTVEPPAPEDDLIDAVEADPAGDGDAPYAGLAKKKPAPTTPPRGVAPEPSEGGIPTMGQADRVAPPERKGPPKAKMADSDDGGGFGTVLMIGGGALIAVFAAFFLMRMRANKNIETDAELAAESDDADLNPFAAIGGESEEAEAADQGFIVRLTILMGSS